ncbi:MAG TPA: dipeptidase [Candidatus Limnocylindria bacterium]|jgi:acetylornithine deacetylase/succinyl-diaminopimelate desuccinylase-like protein
MTSQTDTVRMTDAALDYLREHQDQHLAQLDAFLSIPSVSADPERAADVRRTAEWIVAELTRLGVERATLHETSHHPIVTGEWLKAGEGVPTVLVYCHYDVQPADPLEEWIRPPFEPRHENDRVYARGAGDDKGQLFMHLKAVEAWMKTAGSLPVNLRFFFEGDEEVGSEPIEQFIADHAELLQADVCVVSDGDTFDDEGTPAIGHGLRGIAYWEVKVHGPRQDVHSGQYGGGVDNPANVLVRMLASLTDADGRFTVPGFYDDVRELTDDERAAYASLPFDERTWADETGVPQPMQGEAGYTLRERLSARPTFDINGLWGGYSGEGSKTIIPAWAAAKISTRLVPDQDHRKIERQVVDHLKAIAPPTVRVEVKVIHGGAPAVTPLDHPGVAAAARALEAGFGTAPLFQRSGGSVPVVAALDAHLGIKTLMVGFANPTGNFHAPNEWMSLRNIRDGMASLVHLWSELGAMTASDLRGADSGG